MSLNLDRSDWKLTRLGDVIRRSRKQVDPFKAGVERYVAGGHVDSDSILIQRWGHPNDGQMGSTFTYAFEPGQILFVSARPYLRKTGVVDFSGVVADKTYVLDAVPEDGLLQEFLPFVLSSTPFIRYAMAEATGSMNPRLLWGPLQRYEFDLPPLHEQRRIADLLWAAEHHRHSLANAFISLRGLKDTIVEDVVASVGDMTTLGEVAEVNPREAPLPPDAPFIEMADVDEWGEWASPSGVRGTRGGTRAKGGDTLMARITPCLENGKIAKVPAGLEAVGGSTEFIVLRARSGMLPEFLFHWATSRPVHTAAVGMMSGSTGRRRVAGKDLSTMTVRLPTLQEQTQVVRDVAVIDQARSLVFAESTAVRSLYESLLNDVFGGN